MDVRKFSDETLKTLYASKICHGRKNRSDKDQRFVRALRREINNRKARSISKGYY